jgi:hypothetical protein
MTHAAAGQHGGGFRPRLRLPEHGVGQHDVDAQRVDPRDLEHALSTRSRFGQVCGQRLP